MRLRAGVQLPSCSGGSPWARGAGLSTGGTAVSPHQAGTRRGCAVGKAPCAAGFDVGLECPDRSRGGGGGGEIEPKDGYQC